MPWVVAAAAITAGGAIYASNQASKAADKQTAAAEQGLSLQQAMFDKVSADLSPFRAAGLSALEQLAASLNVDTGAGFKKSPGYDFVFNETMRGVNAGAADAGLYGSGARLKGLADRAAGLASQDYYTYKRFANDEYFNKLSHLGNIANLGQNSAARTGAAGQIFANSASSLYGAKGDAQAANAVAQGNIWGGAASDLSAMIGGKYGGSTDFYGNPFATMDSSGNYTPGSGGFQGSSNIFSLEW